MGDLQIKLFGEFQITLKNRRVASVKKSRVKELLAFLLLNSNSFQPRQKLAFQFWPDCSEKQALTNLRNVLYYLRKNLPDSGTCILADQKNLRWNPESDFYLDVMDFENSLHKVWQTAVDENSDQIIASLVHAVELYKGPLLESMYAEWIIEKRKNLESEFIRALKLLADQLEKKRDFSGAILYTNRLIAVDPFMEHARQKLIHLHALDGDRSNALLAYKKYEQFLRHELDITPSVETCNLYHRIKTGNHRTGNPLRNQIFTGSGEEWKMVGRDREWNLLVTCWKKVLTDSDSRMILLKGVPGIGKSRLSHEFQNYLERQGYLVVSTRSYASAGSVNYGMVIDCLRYRSIRSELKNLDTVWLEELVRLLPELRIEHPHLEFSDRNPESVNRRRLFRAITGVFISSQKPVALFLDDLQWSDPESIAWLDYLLHNEETEKLLVTGSARTVELENNRDLKKVLSGLQQENMLEVFELNPLKKTESDYLTEMLSGNQAENNIKDAIFRETEGNPLFIIEFLREGHILSDNKRNKPPESPENEINERMLPERVSAVINNRFQQLDNKTRSLMEMAATIGREFTFNILLEASEIEDKELVHYLDILLEHRIIQERNSHLFDFTHDKLREVAYARISRQKKRLYHKQIADAYTKYYSGQLEEFSGRLAFHFDKAGEVSNAIDWYEHAAKNARNVLSKQDVTFYRRAVDLTAMLPEGEERVRRERDLLAGLAVSLLHQKEHKAEEVVSVCERVKKLCDQLDELPAPPILFSFAMAKLLTGNLSDAFEIGLEMIELARKREDSVAIAKACYIMGGFLIYLKGDAIHSSPYILEGLEHYDPDQHQMYMKLYDIDAGVVMQAARVSLEFLRDKEDAGIKLGKKAFENAIQSDRPFNIVYMHYMMAWWQVLLRNPKRALMYLMKFSELKSTDYELFHWSIHSKVLSGWTKTETGSPETGIDLMRDGISELESYSFIPDMPYYYGLLAEILGNRGEFDEAFSLIEKSKNFMKTYDVRFPEAEIFRTEGELILLKNPKERKHAEKSLNKAIQIARKQGTKLFEKRALTVLNNMRDLKPA